MTDIEVEEKTENPGDRFRVDHWDDFIGQDSIKDRLSVQINSFHEREANRLDHIFLYGPPGYGKTTLGGIIANSLGADFASLVMPVDERVLRNTLEDVYAGIVMLDELHRASRTQQEQLLTLLEDGYLQFKSGRRIDAEHITVIGATTERGKIIEPLFDRFTTKLTLESYTTDQMVLIMRGMFKRVYFELEQKHRTSLHETWPNVINGLAEAAGGVPRRLKEFVMMVRDLIVTGRPVTTEIILDYCKITPDGLTDLHVRYLRVMGVNGGQMGLAPLALHLDLSPAMVMELERLLVDKRMVEYSKSGRELTTIGHKRYRALKGEA